LKHLIYRSAATICKSDKPADVYRLSQSVQTGEQSDLCASCLQINPVWDVSFISKFGWKNIAAPVEPQNINTR
jgi:hypothetical protein